MASNKKRKSSKTQWWIGYCRKSTDTEDKQVNSLQDQATMIADYYAHLPDVERQRPLRILQEAQSAYHPGRPVFGDLVRAADRGEVWGLIVVHPNRVSRNHADSGAFVQRLVEGTIRSLDTTSGKRYTGEDSNDIFMLTLEGAMSWKDSRDKGDRILQAMRMRTTEGKHMGMLRIGYRRVYRPDGTSELEADPENACMVRRLFELAATGTYSVRALVTEADRMGLRSKKGNKIWVSNLHAILRDPLYKGLVRFDGIVAKGRHEAVVDEDLWERVQAILSGRSTNVGKPKNLALRELFFFGDLLKCPSCARVLCPYRAKGKYVYYECKNPRRDCKVLVPQPVLMEQLPQVLTGIALDKAELKALPAQLLAQHKARNRNDADSRRALHAEYGKVVKEIGTIFLQRQEAESLGILDVVDLRLSQLRLKRDELQAGLSPAEEGEEWIEKAVQSFNLIELLREAIMYGSRRHRESGLKAMSSNFTVEGKKLVLKLRSPFLQSAQRGSVHEWCSSLYDVRTEIARTYDLLQIANSTWQETTWDPKTALSA